MSDFSAAALAPVCASCGQLLSKPHAEPTVEPTQAVESRTTAESKAFPPGTVLAGRYRIVSLIGSGGAGEVYRADDLTLEQTVALKFFSRSLNAEPGAVARFHREVRLARQISHPNICRVFDIGEAEGRAFISMEFVNGEDLHSLRRRIGRLSPDKALEVALQLCAGVAAAHAAAVLHRDLKPANVMLDDLGNVRITDFGLAGLAGEVSRNPDAGTPAYMAPEQLAGGEVTMRSDIYALGLVLYELFAGKRAFEPRTTAELVRPGRALLLAENMTGIDPWIGQIILRCLEPDPARRPASVLHVAAALSRSTSPGAAVTDGELGMPKRSPTIASRFPRLAWKLLVTTLAGLALLLMLAPGSTGFGLVFDGKSPNGSVGAVFTWLWCIGLQCFLVLLSMAYVLRSGQR